MVLPEWSHKWFYKPLWQAESGSVCVYLNEQGSILYLQAGYFEIIKDL